VIEDFAREDFDPLSFFIKQNYSSIGVGR